MAANDFILQFPLDPEWTWTPVVSSGSVATIKRGEPTKLATSGSVAIMVDGDGTTSQRFTGIAKSTSTDTASAAGVVTLWQPLPGLVYAGKAKDITSFNSVAEVNQRFGKRVVFDLTSTTWTVDTEAADSATNGVIIVGGDYQTSTVWFYMAPQVTLLY